MIKKFKSMYNYTCITGQVMELNKPQTSTCCGFLQQNNQNVGDLNFNPGTARACPGLQLPMKVVDIILQVT